MGHSNRGRLSVDLGGSWRIYTITLPAGSSAVGAVTRDGDAGALARIDATGLYVQVNAGVIRTLDQRKVRAAMEAAGNGA